MSASDFVFGSVKWFNPSKGYGFIIHDDKEIFVHSKKLRESGFISSRDTVINLNPGDKLKFKIENGPKGLFAVEISKA